MLLTRATEIISQENHIGRYLYQRRLYQQNVGDGNEDPIRVARTKAIMNESYVDWKNPRYEAITDKVYNMIWQLRDNLSQNGIYPLGILTKNPRYWLTSAIHRTKKLVGLAMRSTTYPPTVLLKTAPCSGK